MSETTTPPVDGDDPDLREPLTEQTETTRDTEHEDAAEQRFERRHRRNDPKKRVMQALSKAKEERERADTLARELAEERRRNAELMAQRVGTAASLATTELEQAKAALLAAQMDGDHAATTAAYEKLARATVAADRAVEEQRRVEAQSKAPPVHQEQKREPSPALQEWMDENPWFQTDSDMTDAAMKAHHDAVRSGLKPETRKYFAFIDQRIRKDFPDAFEDDDDAGEASETEAAPPPARTQAPSRPAVAAAPRRNAAVNTPAPTRTVRLTAEQREHARVANVSEQAYAASLQRLKQSGKIT